VDRGCQQVIEGTCELPADRAVVLSEVAYKRIETYAAFAGISIDRAASDAITEWVRTTGDLVVEALQRNRKASGPKTKLTIVSGASPRNRPRIGS